MVFPIGIEFQGAAEMSLYQRKTPWFSRGCHGRLWSRQESNLNPGLRRPLYYPLYYETSRLQRGCSQNYAKKLTDDGWPDTWYAACFGLVGLVWNPCLPAGNLNPGLRRPLYYPCLPAGRDSRRDQIPNPPCCLIGIIPLASRRIFGVVHRREAPCRQSGGARPVDDRSRSTMPACR